MDRRQRIYDILIADGLSDGNVRESCYDGDVTADSYVNRLSLDAFIDEQLGDGALFQMSVVFAQDDLLAGSQGASEDTSDAQSADIVIISQVAYLHLQWFLVQILKRSGIVYDRFE